MGSGILGISGILILPDFLPQSFFRLSSQFIPAIVANVDSQIMDGRSPPASLDGALVFVALHGSSMDRYNPAMPEIAEIGTGYYRMLFPTLGNLRGLDTTRTETVQAIKHGAFYRVVDKSIHGDTLELSPIALGKQGTLVRTIPKTGN